MSTREASVNKGDSPDDIPGAAELRDRSRARIAELEADLARAKALHDRVHLLDIEHMGGMIDALKARVAEVESERDAIVKAYLRHIQPDRPTPLTSLDEWRATIPYRGGVEFKRYNTEAEAVAAVRKAAGLDGEAIP